MNVERVRPDGLADRTARVASQEPSRGSGLLTLIAVEKDVEGPVWAKPSKGRVDQTSSTPGEIESHRSHRNSQKEKEAKRKTTTATLLRYGLKDNTL
jgi:hypothetical protein